MKNLIFACCVVLLISCGSEENKELKTSADSVAANTANANVLEKWFRQSGDLPFTADSLLFSSVKTMDSLGSAEVKILAADPVKHELSGHLDYELQEFYSIDSVKATGTYLKWSETLEIGMTKFANAYAIKKVKLNDSTGILFWALSTSSYEACPYSSGITVLGTVMNKNVPGNCFYLGEIFGAGDPPVSMERNAYGTVDKEGKITIKVAEMQDEDMDQPFYDVIIEYYEFKLEGGAANLVKEDKQKPVKTPRPKQAG